MTSSRIGDGNAVGDSCIEELVVVRVEDQINPTLTGRSGASYESPPQAPELARTLVRLLLGWPAEPLDGQTRWRHPVAGGMRTVTLLATDKNRSPGRRALLPGVRGDRLTTRS